jgi:hypothetical protein
VRGLAVLHIDRGGLKKTAAPVRRSWVSRSAEGAAFQTGFSRKSRYGYVCRIPTLRALRAGRNGL